MEFQRFAYMSEQAQPFDVDSLQLLASEAGALNSLDGITGLLFVIGSNFVHIVEGGHEAIADLRKRLERDARHKNINVLLEEEADERLFLGWDMRYLDGRDASAGAVAALIRPRELPTHVAAIIDTPAVSAPL